ncbi:MAG TPA: enoyl-CoA hydratase [Candidatus Binatia bacterium]|jgi:enoyl-CoA hydratase/carnithine racemase|nr:enoyl-CoA hydratase [Candidatus Binatia bacterium]
MYQEIIYEVADPVATITLNRPHALNAWTTRMGAEVKHAMAAAEADASVVAIVLTGAGRGFCAGADLNDLKSLTQGKGIGAVPADLDANPGDPAMGDSFRGTYTYPLSIRKPVIAAINGPVAGMAVPIVLACDLRFASDRASFTTAFARRGLIAEWGVSWLLTRVVGTAHALDLLFSARKVEAPEAERMGLVNRVLPHDELLPFVQSYVADLGASCSPASMAVMKRQVWQHWTSELGAAEKEAVKLMVESFGRPDFREGVTSFLEKRAPRFPRIAR